MTIIDADNIWEKFKLWINFEFKKFLNEEQDPEDVRKIILAINPMLIEKEKILYIAVEKKPFVNWLPDALIMTTVRCIQYQRTLFGFNLIEDKWSRVVDVTIEEAFFGTRIQMIHRAKPGESGYLHWDVQYLPKRQARELYAVGREMAYRGHRKTLMRDYQKNMSKVPQIMINSSGGNTHNIFEGLIPPDKVPAMARGMGFVELSEAIDGRGGRSVVPDIDEQTIRQLDAEIRLNQRRPGQEQQAPPQQQLQESNGNDDDIQEIAPPSFAMRAAPSDSSEVAAPPSAKELNARHQARIAQIRAEGSARVAAGGNRVVPSAVSQAAAVSSAPPKKDPLAELKRIKDQLKAGAITEEEYEKLKAEVLGSL